MDEKPDEIRQCGEARKAPDKGSVGDGQTEGGQLEGKRAKGTRTRGTPAEGAQAEGAPVEGAQAEGAPVEGCPLEGGRQVSLCCIDCENFMHAPLLRHLDACVDALESAAASITIDGQRPATAEDNRRVRTLNRQFGELRNLMDHLAISVVEMSMCCRKGEAKCPEDAGQPAADTPAPSPAAGPALTLVSVNPRPRSRGDLMPPGGPGEGTRSQAPTQTSAPRLRCV